MKRRLGFFALVVGCALPLRAQIFSLEPDNYTNGALLGTALANVNLAVAGSDNAANTFFKVMAVDDNFDFAPTGVNVFGHDGIPFFSSGFRLRIDFPSPVNFIALDFAGGNSLTPERGRLELYNGANLLLETYTSEARLGGVVERLALTRATPDVAYAIVYTPAEFGAFGRFDNLSFGFVAVPEPATPLLIAALVAVVALSRRRRC